MFLELRKLAIIAMFSDDVLMDRLVLKGGNALDIVLQITGRTSTDLDFSIEGDFEDLEDIKRRTERALFDRFDSAGYRIFGFQFGPTPPRRKPGLPDEWGGYRVEFMVLKKEKLEAFIAAGGKEERLHTIAEDVIGHGKSKKMTIEISHHEYTEGKIEVELDSHLVYVYTPVMIAIEKIRAICQQMPEYGLRGEGTPRARDFYDIYRICGDKDVHLDSPEAGELLKHMFDAKRVPLKLLGKISETKDYHEQNWVQVVADAREPLSSEGFGTYFDFVVNLIGNLKIPRDE
jgi:predicted nucleotidyltransferase component of viral defense system